MLTTNTNENMNEILTYAKESESFIIPILQADVDLTHLYKYRRDLEALLHCSMDEHSQVVSLIDLNIKKGYIDDILESFVARKLLLDVVIDDVKTSLKNTLRQEMIISRSLSESLDKVISEISRIEASIDIGSIGEDKLTNHEKFMLDLLSYHSSVGNLDALLANLNVSFKDKLIFPAHVDATYSTYRKFKDVDFTSSIHTVIAEWER